MIISLTVKNVALIEEAEIHFKDGLNILSGETGAGKSILIDSITFLLGERPGKDFIRSGAETASVEGFLTVSDPEALQNILEMGIETDEDGALLLSRSLNLQGRSVCRVNGRNVTVGMLKEIAANLVDIHGQHQHQSLLNPNKHIVLLDRFCGEELEERKKELADQITAYRETSKELRELQGAPGQREAQMEIWQFQANELGAAKLKPGEEAELESSRNRLSAVDKLSKNAGEALYLLHGGAFDVSSATDQVGKALQLLTELARFDEAKQPLADRLTELSISLADIVGELSDYTESLDADPQALEKVEERLDLIYRLKKKYNAATAEALITQHEKVTEQLTRANDSDGEIARLTTKRRTQMQAIASKCNEMTTIRRECAAKIQSRIVEVLRDLGMKQVEFAVSMEKQAAFGTNGNDKLEFMLAPNVGSGLKPLSQIASGGEMSRVMLAMKTVMADVDGISTLIFDEIDTGVSGRTAQQVAEKLAQISRGHQLLCITHLPQIAAMADSHLLISKATEGGTTVTSVRELDREGIINELARLIGGARITEATLKAAGEMKGLADLLK